MIVPVMIILLMLCSNLKKYEQKKIVNLIEDYYKKIEILIRDND